MAALTVARPTQRVRRASGGASKEITMVHPYKQLDYSVRFMTEAERAEFERGLSDRELRATGRIRDADGTVRYMVHEEMQKKERRYEMLHGIPRELRPYGASETELFALFPFVAGQNLPVGDDGVRPFLALSRHKTKAEAEAAAREYGPSGAVRG